MIRKKIDEFIQNAPKYFTGSYHSFEEFGGPSVYFHDKCLRECQKNFLSERHVELIYATLTSWGMHRMGKPEGKLKDWNDFYDSIRCHREELAEFKNCNVAKISHKEYKDILRKVEKVYLSIEVSKSNQTIVAHSKAMFHILPKIFPPIDRRYTMDFLREMGGHWVNSNGKYRKISKNLLNGLNREEQFNMFCGICVNIKEIGDRLSWDFDKYFPDDVSVYPLKAIDNAIVKYVKTSGNRRLDGIQ